MSPCARVRVINWRPANYTNVYIRKQPTYLCNRNLDPLREFHQLCNFPQAPAGEPDLAQQNHRVLIPLRVQRGRLNDPELGGEGRHVLSGLDERSADLLQILLSE